MALLGDRVTRLEERLQRQSNEGLEARPRHAEMSDEEVVEVGLIMLAYIFEGDTDAYARMLVEKASVDVEKARENAGILGTLLELRRASAPDPGRPA